MTKRQTLLYTILIPLFLNEYIPALPVYTDNNGYQAGEAERHMKKTVRCMTLCLAAAVLGWGLLFLLRPTAPAAPADGGTLPAAETASFSLVLVLTDGDAVCGALKLDISAGAAKITELPAHTRLSADGQFVSLAGLSSQPEVLCAALSRRLDAPAPEQALCLSYTAAARLMQQFFGGVTLTLDEDVPVPFIGGRLILPAGRCTLSPQQVIAYWRQAADPVTAVQRQGEVIALLLTRWFSGERQEKGEELFAALVNAGETNWRIDRYTRQKRTLSALADAGAAVKAVLADGETVGQGDRCRYELHELSALEGAYENE